MKEKVKIVPNQFKLDTETMTYPELRVKYGLSNAMIKRVMLQLGIEKRRVQSSPFEIVEENNVEDFPSPVNPDTSLEEDMDFRNSEVYTDTIEEIVTEIPVEEELTTAPAVQGERMFGINPEN